MLIHVRFIVKAKRTVSTFLVDEPYLYLVELVTECWDPKLPEHRFSSDP